MVKLHHCCECSVMAVGVDHTDCAGEPGV